MYLNWNTELLQKLQDCIHYNIFHFKIFVLKHYDPFEGVMLLCSGVKHMW